MSAAVLTKSGDKTIWRKFLSVASRAIILAMAFRIGKHYYLHLFPGPLIDAEVLYSPAWKVGEPSKVFIFLSEETIQTRFEQSSLVLEKDITYGQPFTHSVTVKDIKKPKDRVYAHVYVCRNAKHPNPDVSGFHPLDTAYRRIMLVRKTSSQDKLFWYPDMKVSIVPITEQLDITNIPTPYRPHMSIERKSQSILPIIYSHENWQLKQKRIFEFKEKSLDLNISIDFKSHFMFRMMASIGAALEKASETNEFMAGEYEQLKELLTETSTWLLILTISVSLLHSLFDFLAFKNDVQFWQARKDDLQGLSLRSILLNLISQIIILLYLVDQKSSWLIIVSSAVGLFIEMWKISKVVHRSGSFNFKFKQTDRSTDQYDKEAIRYLSIVFVPLMIAYTMYSLFNDEFRSWYSFILNTAVGFVYAFGFVLMTPQLYVNYKLKSIAHMPWRTFTYKALNTIVDDLFAFAIRMPIMHRISCFRDDVLFLVYLYQLWIYPVDMSRVNEYGQSFGKKDN